MSKQMTEEHRNSLAQYTIADLKYIRDGLGMMLYNKLNDTRVNVVALNPDLVGLLNMAEGWMAEASETLNDIIEELKLEENSND